MILPDHISKKNQMIINRYGLEHQIRKLQEECAEVIQAGSKYLLAAGMEERATKEQDLKMEMVDVMVLMDQIVERIQMTQEEIDTMAMYKIDRTIGRMKK